MSNEELMLAVRDALKVNPDCHCTCGDCQDYRDYKEKLTINQDAVKWALGTARGGMVTSGNSGSILVGNVGYSTSANTTLTPADAWTANLSADVAR